MADLVELVLVKLNGHYEKLWRTGYLLRDLTKSSHTHRVERVGQIDERGMQSSVLLTALEPSQNEDHVRSSALCSKVALDLRKMIFSNGRNMSA